MSSFSLLDQAEEDALHKARLLNVEEKPFRRITKRLLAPNALIVTPVTLPPTPPPDANAADEEAAAHERTKQQLLEERRQWKEDALLDFAAFESSIIRIQFLLTSNDQERERYAAEKVKILETAQAVRENIAELRTQLDEAQQTLALRKEYDQLAESIFGNPALRPRDEQLQNIDKLHGEIAELERESLDYAQTWAERRDQFGRIIEEGMQLRRLIRDEKEEVERREGMEGEGQEEGDEEHKANAGGTDTPRPESGGSGTPLHNPEKSSDESFLRGSSVDPEKRRGTTPLREVTGGESQPDVQIEQIKQDDEMAEDGELEAESEENARAPEASPTPSRHDPGADKMDVT